MRNEIYSNIIVSGGSSGFKGLESRLYSEMKSLNGTIKNISVLTTGDTIRSAWQGGAIIASLENFRDHLVTHEMYLEEGVRPLINKKEKK